MKNSNSIVIFSALYMERYKTFHVIVADVVNTENSYEIE